MIVPALLIIVTALLFSLAVYYVGFVLQKHRSVITSEKFSKEKKARMIFNLIVRTGDIWGMNLTLTLSAIFTFADTLFVGRLIYRENMPEAYLLLSAAIPFFLLGVIGLLYCVREEMPGRITNVKGPEGKFFGGLYLVIGWGGSIATFIYAIYLALQ